MKTIRNNALGIILTMILALIFGVVGLVIGIIIWAINTHMIKSAEDRELMKQLLKDKKCEQKI